MKAATIAALVMLSVGVVAAGEAASATGAVRALSKAASRGEAAPAVQMSDEKQRAE